MPTDDTYSAALGGLEKWFTPHRAQGAQRAFEAIARSGPPPSTRVLQRKATGCAHAGLWQEAEELFSLVVSCCLRTAVNYPFYLVESYDMHMQTLFFCGDLCNSLFTSLCLFAVGELYIPPPFFSS